MKHLLGSVLATVFLAEVHGADIAVSGLYTPADRAEALAILQAHCPELGGIVFDADGDGLVSALEQDGEGRDPLTQILTRESVAAAPAIPWTPDLFPEWLMTAFVQDDAPIGRVNALPTRGVLTSATASAGARAPEKRGARAGIEFAPGAQLNFPGQKETHWRYRWGVLTFRIGPDAPATTLVDVNLGSGPSYGSPRIAYSAQDGLSVRFAGRGAQGLDERVLRSDAVVADGQSWNVAVFGMRQGRLFLSVNGVPSAPGAQPARYSSDRLNRDDLQSRLGDAGAQSAAWAMDALMLGQAEPSEATVRKLTGWAAHRLGFAARLPSGHPYRESRPVLDAEDLPHRFRVDDDTWAALLARNTAKTFTRSRTGLPREEVATGFERVFFDDFRAFRVSDSRSGTGDLWMAPGFNTAVGAQAQLLPPGGDPDVYPHDSGAGLQNLSLAKKNGRWYAGAFYSVNDMGQGYSWTGPKIFRLRCRFPTPAGGIAPGLFPAFWSYGTEHLFWRTSNRIECDWFELDGASSRWLNGLSTHLHYPYIDNPHVRRPESYQRFKLMGAELTERLVGVPGGIDFWDGAFHTWEFAVGPDLTTICITVPDAEAPGGERWIELCRGQTSPTYLERLFLLFDYALRDTDGMPANGERQDFQVDWVEVLQRTEDLAKVPAPFASRPVVRHDAKGFHCEVHVPDVTDLRYYWFADGYPVTYGADSTIPESLVPAGAESVRCMVKAAGALDQPECFSESVSAAPVGPASVHVATEHFFLDALSVAEGETSVVSSFDVYTDTNDSARFTLYRNGGYVSEIVTNATGLGWRWNDYLRHGYGTFQNVTSWPSTPTDAIQSSAATYRIMNSNRGSSTRCTIVTVFRPRPDLGWKTANRCCLWGFGHAGYSYMYLGKGKNSDVLSLYFEVIKNTPAKYRLDIAPESWKSDTWYFAAASLPQAMGPGCEARLYLREMDPRGPAFSPAGMQATVRAEEGYVAYYPQAASKWPFENGGKMGIGGHNYNTGGSQAVCNTLGGDIAYFLTSNDYMTYGEMDAVFNELGIADAPAALLLIR